MQIAKRVFSDIGLLLISSIIGVFMTLKFKFKNTKAKRLIFLLVIGGTIPLLYHLYSLNIRSIWKHTVFSAFFLTPVSAWIIFKIYKSIKIGESKNGYIANLGQLAATFFALTILTNLWFNFSKHWRFQRSWPSATKFVEYLEKNRKEDDKIFAEASAIYKYHLYSGFSNPYSWSSTWFYNYKEKDGLEAMKLAIQEQEFDYVILNNYYTGYINSELINYLDNYYIRDLEDTYKVSGVYDNITTLWKPRNLDSVRLPN